LPLHQRRHRLLDARRTGPGCRAAAPVNLQGMLMDSLLIILEELAALAVICSAIGMLLHRTFG
jgi:hypothetical protein